MMTSSIDGWSDADKREALESVEPAMERTVTEAEHLAGRLKYLESLHKLRQESGITAAMLRDGRAKGFIEAFKTILRWCDRSGEEPEGQCLHEIEQICRKQLGLELLRVSDEKRVAELDFIEGRNAAQWQANRPSVPDEVAEHVRLTPRERKPE